MNKSTQLSHRKGQWRPTAELLKGRPVRAPLSRGFIILGSLLLIVLGVVLASVLFLAGAAAWYWPDLPKLDKATSYRPVQHLQVLTADGVEIGQFGSERRVFVPVAQMPKALKDAVLAIEDTSFYEHGAISWRGVARAIVNRFTRGSREGASTITQQTARTMFLSSRLTFERKMKEALIAYQLESQLSKDQILELYMNQIYLGQHHYGFAAAAQGYFGKTLEQLNLAETALLAGLPQNPLFANPASSLPRALARQRVVLVRMQSLGLITAEQRQQAQSTTLVLRDGRRALLPAQHVAEMARQAVVQRLGEKAYSEGVRVVTSIRADEQRAARAAVRAAVLAHSRRHGWRGPEDFAELPPSSASKEAVEKAAAEALKDYKDDEDLRVAIVTAASPKEIEIQLASGQSATIKGEGLRLIASALQPKAKAELAVKRGSVIRVVPMGSAAAVKPAEKPGEKPGPAPVKDGNPSLLPLPNFQVAQWPQAEAAFVALDPHTGRIRALVGGFSYADNQFNRVTSAQRQPGSSFKPFLYSAAFEAGVMPQSLVDDLPLLNADGGVPNWNPKNSDGRFDGEMSVREALVKSKNLVSIRLLQHVGLAKARQWATRFGFEEAKLPNNLTFALGTGSVTPLQMAGAYAVFANGGYRVAPVLIERITDARGQVLFEAPKPAALTEEARVIPERNAFLVSSLLADVTRRGTAARAQATLKRYDLFGKTGTTNDAVDAWFAGYAPGVVGVAWVGHDEPQSLGESETGGGAALPIWIETMAQMLKGQPVKPLLPPPGVVPVGEGKDTDWRYAEFLEGGWVARVGPPREGAEAAAVASAASSGAGQGPLAVPAPGPALPVPGPGPSPASTNPTGQPTGNP